MCSALDAPDQHDPPTLVRPRTYKLSGDAPEPQPSVALAVLGEMLMEYETAFMETGRGLVEAVAIREARNRVMAAEARL